MKVKKLKNPAVISLAIVLYSAVMFFIVYTFIEKPLPSWVIITEISVVTIAAILFILNSILYSKSIKNQFITTTIPTFILYINSCFITAIGLTNEITDKHPVDYSKLPSVFGDTVLYTLGFALFIFILVFIFLYVSQITKKNKYTPIKSIILSISLFAIFALSVFFFILLWIDKYGFFINIFPTRGRRNYSSFAGIFLSTLLFFVFLLPIKIKNKSIDTWIKIFLENYLCAVEKDNILFKILRKTLKSLIVLFTLACLSLTIYLSVTWGIQRVTLMNHKVYSFSSADLYLLSESNLSDDKKVPQMINQSQLYVSKRPQAIESFLQRNYAEGIITEYSGYEFELSDDMNIIMDLINNANAQILKTKNSPYKLIPYYSWGMHIGDDNTLFIRKLGRRYTLYLYPNEEATQINKTSLHVFHLNNILYSDEDFYVEHTGSTLRKAMSFAYNTSDNIEYFIKRNDVDENLLVKIINSYKSPLFKVDLVVYQYKHGTVPYKKEATVLKATGAIIQSIHEQSISVFTKNCDIIETIDDSKTIIDRLLNDNWDAHY